MRNYCFTLPILAALLNGLTASANGKSSVTVGTFKQEARQEFTVADGLPDNAINSVAVLNGKTVLAGTAKGLVRFSAGRWTVIEETIGAPVKRSLPASTRLCSFRTAR